jgi:hypothetical protein
VRTQFAAALVLAFVIGGCGVLRAQSLMDTLPVRPAGVQLDGSRVIDESFLSGHPADDALADLGKRRSDATIVERNASRGDAIVGAIVVDGVAGDVLLDVIVETWFAASVVRRDSLSLGPREVWTLEHRGGRFTLVFAKGDVVYYVMASDAMLAQAIVSEMP